MQSIKSLVIALFAVVSMLTFARPDTFDRPVHTLSVGGLTTDQSLRKTAIETKVSAAMKKIAQESGSLAFTLAIASTAGNEFMNMGGGWTDYDAGDAVLMSLAYYQSLEATLHLLSTPHNAAALARAIEQDRAGQARPRDLATEQ